MSQIISHITHMNESRNMQWDTAIERVMRSVWVEAASRQIPIRIYHLLHPHMNSSWVKAPKWKAYGCYRCVTNSWYHTRTCTAYTCKAYACVCMCMHVSAQGVLLTYTRIYHSSWVKLIPSHRHWTQSSWPIEYHAWMQHVYPSAYGLGSSDTRSCLTHAYRLGASTIIMNAPS